MTFLNMGGKSARKPLSVVKRVVAQRVEDAGGSCERLVPLTAMLRTRNTRFILPMAYPTS